MRLKFIGTGSSLPEYIATNEFMSTLVDTNNEWIVTRTGIEERRIAKEETTTSMAIEASRNAIRNANILPEDIDIIIGATVTADMAMPSMACEVQAAIGACNAVAFDVNAACSGFLFAINTAYAYFKAGIYKRALIIGAETLSKITDWTDRSTCVLFGDGAGAAIVEACEEGIYEMIQATDGSKGHVLTCGNRGVSNPLTVDAASLDYVQMDGQEVFKFAVKKVPECIMQLIDIVGIEVDELKYLILHQANKRIIQSVAKRLHIPEEKFPVNLNVCGNTSAASIPILLDSMNKDQLLQEGDKLILSGFGGGLTWGAVLLEW